MTESQPVTWNFPQKKKVEKSKQKSQAGEEHKIHFIMFSAISSWWVLRNRLDCDKEAPHLNAELKLCSPLKK